MQYPVEIPGVTTMTFLKTALNSQRRARGEPDLDAIGDMTRPAVGIANGTNRDSLGVCP